LVEEKKGGGERKGKESASNIAVSAVLFPATLVGKKKKKKKEGENKRGRKKKKRNPLCSPSTARIDVPQWICLAEKGKKKKTARSSLTSQRKSAALRIKLAFGGGKERKKR